MLINSRQLTLRRIGAVALAGALLALAGCGGGHHDNNANNDNSAQTDSFITEVNNVIATSSETTEPVTTDAINATTPEQTEPVPLG